MIPLRDASRTPARFPLVTVSLIVVEADAGGIAYAAHVGGAFFGILTARLFERRVERRAMARRAQNA